MDCIFCKIVNGEIFLIKVYEDDRVLVFNDLNLVVLYYILVVFKKYYDSLIDIFDKEMDIVLYIYVVINKIVKEKGFD